MIQFKQSDIDYKYYLIKQSGYEKYGIKVIRQSEGKSCSADPLYIEVTNHSSGIRHVDLGSDSYWVDSEEQAISLYNEWLDILDRSKKREIVVVKELN